MVWIVMVKGEIVKAFPQGQLDNAYKYAVKVGGSVGPQYPL